jgi:hypothetical protein
MRYVEKRADLLRYATVAVAPYRGGEVWAAAQVVGAKAGR